MEMSELGELGCEDVGLVRIPASCPSLYSIPVVDKRIIHLAELS